MTTSKQKQTTTQEPARTFYPVHGTFLVWGQEREPFVVMLSKQQLDDHWLRLGLLTTERGARDHYTRTFGEGVSSAAPAWSVDAMTVIATEYTGDHQQLVRGMAAAIALGRDPYPNRPDDWGGGEKVPRKPTQPRGGSPARVPVADPFAVLGN